MKYLKSLIFAFKEIFIMFILQYAVLIACIVCLGKDRSIVIGTILVCAVEILYVILNLKMVNLLLENIIFFLMH